MRDIIVLKCGGSTIDRLPDQFFTNIVALKASGLHPILVHGGGPAIKEMLGQLNIDSQFVDGLRKTTKPVLEVVEKVLAGQVNKAIARKLTKAGSLAVGLSGTDANLLTAKPKDVDRYGYVGKITNVNTSFLIQLISNNIIPVIAPIATGINGEKYNVNADTAAGAVAKMMDAERLIFVTNVPGVMREGQLLESVTDKEIESLIARGIIHGGMIPKVRAAVDSLKDGLQEVMIIDGIQSIHEQDGQLTGTVIKNSVGVV